MSKQEVLIMERKQKNYDNITVGNMKIIMILATGTLLTFPTVEEVNPDCFSQGYAILEKLATYHGPEEKGKDQGWLLNNSNLQVGGWYCR